MTQPRTLGLVARLPFGYFFNTVLFGVQAVARQHNLNVLVIQGAAESVATTQVARDQVDAWLVMPNGGDANTLLRQGKLTITIGMHIAPLHCPAVLPDNCGGIEAARQHLAAHGHEQIAFVGWTELGDIQERYEGYQAALAQRGQALVLNRVVFASSAGRVQPGQRYLAASFPPLELLPAPQSAADTPTTLLLPLQSNAQEWGYLAPSGALLAAELRLAEGGTDHLIIWSTHLATMLERRQLVNELRQAYESGRILVCTMRDLGAPIIQLVGAIDTGRAQQVISAVLEGVSQNRASTVLLDLTAVPIVDTQVANTLIQNTQAAKLLGAQVILVGIRPEIAQSIVSLGINLQSLSSPRWRLPCTRCWAACTRAVRKCTCHHRLIHKGPSCVPLPCNLETTWSGRNCALVRVP